MTAPTPAQPAAPQGGDVEAHLRDALAGHLYDEFLGGLGQVWTTCTCGAQIDATFGEGRTSAEVFKANWSSHVAEVLADWVAAHDAEVRASAARETAERIAGAMGGVGTHRDPCRIPDTECLCGVCEFREDAARIARAEGDR